MDSKNTFFKTILVIPAKLSLMKFYYLSSTSISMEKANNFISDRVRRV